MVTKFIRSLQYINYTDHCISLAHEICGLINTNYKLQTQKPRLHWHFKTVSKWFQIGLGQLCERPNTLWKPLSVNHLMDVVWLV